MGSNEHLHKGPFSITKGVLTSKGWFGRTNNQEVYVVAISGTDTAIKENYNILNTVTFGSPLINGFKREGTVKRLGDVKDVVPYMSLTTFTNIVWQSADLNKEDGGKTLTLDYATTAFYFSPVTITE